LFTDAPSPTARFIACVIVSFLVISVDHQHQQLAALRSVVAMGVYPLQYLASLPVALVDMAARNLASRGSLLQDNEQLVAENFRLKTRTLRFEALESENGRLRALLDSSTERGEQSVVADLLAVDSNPAAQQIVIDKGSRDHIYVGQPIADAHGILGQVVQVAPFSSTALLISDARHAMAVQVNRTGLRAIAVGAGHSTELFLSFVPPKADVRVGDLVVSSGLDNRFPAGYPVGVVTGVSLSPGEPFARIAVKPSAQIGSSHEVLLVWPQLRPEPPAGMP
jgi:rod shape-determining protein MreC